MIFIGIIVAIAMFSLIILFHELGHFWTARKFGVKVEEFGMGIPPKAKELFTDKKGTVYTLNWLPLGGFVRLKGENPNELKNKNDPEALTNKTYLQKSVILLGGVAMNFLLATLIFSILFFIGVKPIGINARIETDLNVKIIPTVEHALKSGLLNDLGGVIIHPVEGSLAEKSDIEKGMWIFSINDTFINSHEEVVQILHNNKGKTLHYLGYNNSLLDDKLNKEFYGTGGFYGTLEEQQKIIDSCYSGFIDACTTRDGFLAVGDDGRIGAYISKNIKVNESFEYKYGVLESIRYGSLETYNQSLLTVKGLGILLQKIVNPKIPEEREQAVKEMKGPIGIVDLVANSLEAGIIFIMIIAAIISINLGVFNLLPIPALDGGRWLLITINSFIEKLFGKKAVNENTENLIHVIFFVLLIVLSVIIGYNDVSNILDR